MGKSDPKKPQPLAPLKFRSAGFSIIRSPLLPADTFAPKTPSGPETLEQRTSALFSFVKQTPVWEALKSTSPSLAKAIDAPRKGQERSEIASAVMRYVERMRGRATPFGLCAGYAVVPTTTETSLPLQLEPPEKYNAILRLDVDALMTAVRTAVVGDRARRHEYMWAPTREIVYVADMAKVTRRSGDGSVSYADVERSEALDVIMAAASPRANWETCLAALAPFTDDREMQEGYLHRLIDEGILVPEAYPSISTDDELAPVAELRNPELDSVVRVARENRVGPIGPRLLTAAETLEKAISEFRKTDKERSAKKTADDKVEIAEQDAPAKAEDSENSGEEGSVATPPASADPACIYDLMKTLSSGALGDDFFKELTRIAAVVQRFMVKGGDPRQAAFCRFLMERYEGREVPLVEALDPDFGFAFPVDPTGVQGGGGDYSHQATLTAWRLKLYTKAMASGTREIVLTEADLPPAPPPESQPRVPLGMSVFAKLQMKEGQPIFVEPTIVAPPGTAYFGRASGVSRDIRERAEAFIKAQSQYVDADVAQLTYFLPGRSAAFVQYPCLTPYELVLSARPGASEEQRIDVNDLLVSPVGDQAILRSRKTGRRISVVATGAANPNREVLTGLARFLLTVERDDFGGAFHWGAFSEAPFLPRVRFEQHILSPMKWRVTKEQTRPILDGKTVTERWNAVQKLRADLGLPRHILFAEHSDNLLPVDLDDVLSVEAWLSTAREDMPLIEHNRLGGVVGPTAFHHEMVFPLVSTWKPAAGATSAAASRHHYQDYDEKDAFDTIMPGGNCLYLRIYGGRGELISVIRDTLSGLLEEAHDKGEITHWFFLPFTDPDAHIRVRAFGDPGYLFGKLLPAMHNALAPQLATRVIRKVEVSSYERETYRYGGPESTNICERIFCASSQAALTFHEQFEGDGSSAIDLLVPTVGSLRSMVAQMGLDTAEMRKQFTRTGELYTRTEDKMIPKRAAGEFLRRAKPKFLEPVDPKVALGEKAIAALKKGFDDLRHACETKVSKRDYSSLCSDIMHVHSIRLLTTWCEIPNTEAIAYFLGEKVLAADAAIQARDAAK
ncbi:MAG: lantibiotic dehydratase [Polyangiaceae bacterium]